MRADGQPVSPCRHPMPHFDSCLADEVLADEVQGRLNSYRISQFFGRRPGCAPPIEFPPPRLTAPVFMLRYVALQSAATDGMADLGEHGVAAAEIRLRRDRKTKEPTMRTPIPVRPSCIAPRRLDGWTRD
jgi:hypothetical protein